MSRLDFVIENKEVSEQDREKLDRQKDKRELKKLIEKQNEMIRLLQEQLTAINNRLAGLENRNNGWGGIYVQHLAQPLGTPIQPYTWQGIGSSGTVTSGNDSYTLTTNAGSDTVYLSGSTTAGTWGNATPTIGIDLAYNAHSHNLQHQQLNKSI